MALGPRGKYIRRNGGKRKNNYGRVHNISIFERKDDGTLHPVDAEEAHKTGFVNKVVTSDEIDTSVNALASAIASKSKVTILSTKAHVNAVTSQVRHWQILSVFLLRLKALKL